MDNVPYTNLCLAKRVLNYENVAIDICRLIYIDLYMLAIAPIIFFSRLVFHITHSFA